jgi:hypothetical protein
MCWHCLDYEQSRQRETLHSLEPETKTRCHLEPQRPKTLTSFHRKKEDGVDGKPTTRVLTYIKELLKQPPED